MRHLTERGLSSARSAQIAAYATRRAKDRTGAPHSLFEGWRAKAAALTGFLNMNPSGPVPITDVVQDAVRRVEGGRFVRFRGPC